MEPKKPIWPVCKNLKEGESTEYPLTRTKTVRSTLMRECIETDMKFTTTTTTGVLIVTRIK